MSIKADLQTSLKIACFGGNGQGKTHLACGVLLSRPQPAIIIDVANTINKKNIVNVIHCKNFDNAASLEAYLKTNNNEFIDCKTALILRGLDGLTIDSQKKEIEGLFEFLLDFMRKLDRKGINFKKTVFVDEADAYLGKHSTGAFPLLAKQARNYDTDILTTLKAPQDINNSFLRELDYTYFYNLQHRGDFDYLRNRCGYPDEFIQALSNLQKHQYCCYDRANHKVTVGYMPKNLLKYV